MTGRDPRYFDPDMTLVDSILSKASQFLEEGGTLELNYVEAPTFLKKVYEYGWDPAVIEGTDYTRLWHEGVLDTARFILVRQKDVEKRRMELDKIKDNWEFLSTIQEKMGAVYWFG